MREKDENTDALGIYTFLTSETSTQEPNVYAGRKGQILKGFSNVYQNHPLTPTDVKRAAAERWVAAMNADGTYGRWAYGMARKTTEVTELITTAADDQAVRTESQSAISF